MKKTSIALKLLIGTIAAVTPLLATGSTVNAGVAGSELTIAATSSTSIEAGGTVTFSYSFSCYENWSSAQLQPFTGTTNLGSPVTLTRLAPTNVSAAGLPSYNVTGTFTLTFSSVGTFAVDAKVPAVSDGAGCELDNATVTVTVTVAAAATTTVAPTTTTTVVTTTVEEAVEEVLPQTGSDNAGALVAMGIGLAGVAILISRRRLLNN